MRTKKVNRYWCDHCNKAGLQSRSMAIHEKHCTMNPARECRMCKLLVDGHDSDFEQKTLAELMALLPDNMEWADNSAYHAWCESVQEAFKLLRAASGDCPACIMAALRQKGIPVPMVDDFDFKAEVKSIFDDLNEARHEAQGHYFYG